jgi:hypothetical protein
VKTTLKTPDEILALAAEPAAGNEKETSWFGGQAMPDPVKVTTSWPLLGMLNIGVRETVMITLFSPRMTLLRVTAATKLGPSTMLTTIPFEAMRTSEKGDA